jgi:hypothetical protein
MRRLSWTTAILVGLLGWTRPAYAVFGEEDWISGQNEILLKMVGAHMQEIAQLTSIINNTRETVSAANDIFALVRTMRRTYEMIVRYDLDDLTREAKAGLYEGFPELAQLEDEVRLGAANVEDFGRGSDPFFQHWDHHDATTREAAKRTFQRAYQASIWPAVFPQSLKFHPNPSPAEALVQQHYLHTGDAQRRAVQKTALAVLAGKVNTFVRDAELKDNVALRTEAVHAQIALQDMQNSTELLNFKEQEVGAKEFHRQQDEALREQLGAELAAQADVLVTIPRAR